MLYRNAVTKKSCLVGVLANIPGGVKRSEKAVRTTLFHVGGVYILIVINVKCLFSIFNHLKIVI